jgi:hypothetical protein
MTKLKWIFILCWIFVLKHPVSAQNTDRYWVFGDSAAIDFRNLTNPVPDMSILRSRGTCASICNSAGNLLFYAGSPKVPPYPTGTTGLLRWGYAVNKNHNLMDNGAELVGGSWYQEMIIVSNPGDSLQYYLFCAGETAANNGLYYSIIDLSYNNGLGKVIQKNVRLSSDTLCDGIAAVRHGNGRDWWIVKRSYAINGNYTNNITCYLVSPSGVAAMPTQYIGIPTTSDGFLRMKFNDSGDKMYNVSGYGLIERFDFDRCTGLFSNQQTFNGLNSPYFYFWSFEVSPDESKLYTSMIYQTFNQDTSYLLQFDLNAANFAASADTLATYPQNNVPGILKKGPDNKIYLSVTSLMPDTCFDYLLCYGTSDSVNSSLSVIHSPDSLGAACDFRPNSFNLGGHKAYWGLPNNPNYELGRWVGSPCDTLTVGITEAVGYKNNITVYYDVNWQTAFVNAKGLRGKKFAFELYNINGQLIQQQQGFLDSEYYTNNLSMVNVADGLYVVRLKTEKEVLTGKFIKR